MKKIQGKYYWHIGKNHLDAIVSKSNQLWKKIDDEITKEEIFQMNLIKINRKHKFYFTLIEYTEMILHRH